MSNEIALNARQADQKRDKWFRGLYTVLWPIFRLLYPLRVVGRENIPEGAVVICPNHTSWVDPFYVVFAFGRKYPLRAIAKIQIMRVPIVGWVLDKAGVFGVDRGAADIKAVKTALKTLKDGNRLLIFPEGTRVHEGEEVEAKTGAAMFATRTGVPLMPVYIQRKKKLFRRNVVVIGQPYSPEFAGRKPTPDELDIIANDLMSRVRGLGEGQE